VVGAILFLRFIVPIFSSYKHKEKRKEKNMMFLARFLMKLCCHSKFSESEGGCLVNEVLVESFDLFDKFCLDVVEKGKQFDTKEVFAASIKRTWRRDVALFVGSVEEPLLGFIKPQPDFEELESLWNKFKGTTEKLNGIPKATFF
jgi:hypothetical protein